MNELWISDSLLKALSVMLMSSKSSISSGFLKKKKKISFKYEAVVSKPQLPWQLLLLKWVWIPMQKARPGSAISSGDLAGFSWACEFVGHALFSLSVLRELGISTRYDILYKD